MENKTEILNNQVQSFLASFDISGLLKANVDTALWSGAIDSEMIKEGDLTIAKCIFQITLANAARQYLPLSPEGKKEHDNLLNFI